MVVELEDVDGVVAVLVQQAGQLGAQVLAVTGVVERDGVVLQPLPHVVENQVDEFVVGPVHAVGGCGHGWSLSAVGCRGEDPARSAGRLHRDDRT